MPPKFKGALEDLQKLLTEAGVEGQWKDDGQGKVTFRTEEGGVMNWWPGTGTINVQGSIQAKSELEQALSGVDKAPQKKRPSKPAAKSQSQIFIVHGHDMP